MSTSAARPDDVGGCDCHAGELVGPAEHWPTCELWTPPADATPEPMRHCLCGHPQTLHRRDREDCLGWVAGGCGCPLFRPESARDRDREHSISTSYGQQPPVTEPSPEAAQFDDGPAPYATDDAAGDPLRARYRVPAHVGDRVRVDGRSGRLVGFDVASQYLVVRLDGRDTVDRAHPTWRVDYVAAEVRAERAGGVAR